jgi:hypothetical protein
VFFWVDCDNFDPPFVPVTTIDQAALKILKRTKRSNAFFSAAPAPEHFDPTPDDERIDGCNERICAALVLLGATEAQAKEAFWGVGMPSEWRGALAASSSLARALASSETNVGRGRQELAWRVATICDFVRMSMTVDGSFKWILAVGSRLLADAINESTWQV